jgi:prepilin peptidase CpaA
MPTSLLILLGFLVFAVWKDQTSRRIPNQLIAAGVTAALMLAAYTDGLSGLLHSVLGLLCVLAAMFPFYILRYLGAGDVKLLAMVGAFFGPTESLYVVLYTMIAGGLLAALMILKRRLNNKLVLDSQTPQALATRSTLRLPYAWAVLGGTLASQWRSFS